MRSVTIILHALVVQGLAKEQVHQEQKSADTSADELVDRLVDKLAAKLLGTPSRAVQPRSVLARAQPAFRWPASSPASKYSSIAALPGPSDLKNLVIGKIEETNRGCRVRDVSVKAGEMTAPGEGGTKYSLMAKPGLTEPLTEAKVREMPGITAPLGLFDPLGISTKVPEGQLLFFREAELKHGRVCMLAVLGLIVGERHDFFPLFGDGVDPSVPAYMFGTPYVTQTNLAQFWPVILGALFFEEWRGEYNRKADPDRMPGDYGWDPLGLKPKDPKALKELQNKELNNGRLAMFAAAGIIAQEQLTGHKIFNGLFGIP